MEAKLYWTEEVTPNGNSNPQEHMKKTTNMKKG